MRKQLPSCANSLLTIAISMVLFGCATSESNRISYDRALKISREVAKDNGYDLSE